MPKKVQKWMFLLRFAVVAGIIADKQNICRYIPRKAAFAAEGTMFTTMASICIMLPYIILALVLVILVCGENSVFGHAKVQR